MTDPPDRSIIIRLSSEQTEQTEFLQGLDNWLQLGLLPDWQVRQLCQQHLSCPLPTPITSLAQDIAEEFAGESTKNTTDFANASASGSSPSTRSPSAASTRIGRSLQAFMAEISVIWLLFLGVFLVVVSSGVLAASQWQNFSPVGQYGILFTYTLAFFAAGLWTGQRPNLRLTARMLQITTLLIIPVNFWMMDGLGLWQSSLGIIFESIAALILTAIPLVLLHPQSELLQTNHPRLSAFNSIGLSWLHWGWSIAAIPLIATYAGTIATAFLLIRQQSRGAETGEQETESREQELNILDDPQSPTPNPQSLISPATLVIALSTLLLIGRALLVAEIPPRQLGLALGICGWLWCWLSRTTTPELAVRGNRSIWTPAVWTPVGTALLLLGWAVSVVADPPWQAIVISGLGLWLLVDRLQRTGRSEVLLASFLIGLQAYGLLWRLFPVDLRQSLIHFAAQIVGDAALPQVLIGVAGFPYLWMTLGVTNWLRNRGQEIEGRRQRAESEGLEVEDRRQVDSNSSMPNRRSLVQQAETIAFIFGICLSLISLTNPGVRSLNLLLAACTLIWVIWNRSTVSPALIYLTHITGLAAIVSGIDWICPALPSIQWAAIFLGMMTIEWGFSLGTTALHWRRSAWYIGLALAGLSYVALLAIERNYQTSIWTTLIWLITPGLLTGLSRLRQFPQIRLAAWLSTAALCAQLLLLSSLNTWIAAFAIATLLMVVNTYTLHRLVPAALTIGFALGLEATLVWRWLAEQITDDTILIFLATVLWQLWLLRDWLLQDRSLLRDSSLQNNLNRSQTELKQTYAIAVDGWGLALSGFTLLLLTGFSAVAFATREISGQQTVGMSLVIGAIGYQIWRQPTNLGFWGLAWAVETGMAILIARSGGTVEALGITNLGLGLICQLLGDGWVRQSQRPYRSSWHLIPLTYAIFGLFWVHHTFTAFTGLYTFIAALTGIGVGRRHIRFKPLTLLAVLLSSLAAYELLIYQLLQAESSNPGDGFALLAGLSILLAWSDRFVSRWLVPYLRLINRELQLITHVHWLIGSGLALLAVLNELSSIGTVLLIVAAIALSGYALTMGNLRWNHAAVQEAAGNKQKAGEPRAEGKNTPFPPHPSSFHAVWTYAGIAELLATLSYGLYEAIPDTTFLMAWAGAIASVLAVGLYTPPWQRWGWSAQPWRNAAAVFPAIVILLTLWNVALQSLLITAAFYSWFAKATRQIRLSYLSILLFDWALLRYVHQQGWLNLLWVSAVLGGSLLYVAQIDPNLQAQSARAQRHWLRSLSTGLICLTAFYQAEVETGGTAIGVGIFTLSWGIGLIFAGLLLRIRAFLYIGTATFILRILRWLWLFINSYSLLLWAVGIVLGMVFIWIAATFESRRSQVNAIVHYWSSELENWE